jgi:hypothetical protein
LLAVNSPVMSFALMLAMAGILWYGGRQVVVSILTQGELAQFCLCRHAQHAGEDAWLADATLFPGYVLRSARLEVLDEVSQVRENPESR